MNLQLQDKVAIITGSTKGIGRETALVLVEEGAAVVINCRHDDHCQEYAQELASQGHRVLAAYADVTDPAQVERMVQRTLAAFGRIDILVNNAGVGGFSRFQDSHYEEWKTEIDISLYGVLLCSNAVINHMIERRYGKIITLSSDSAKVGQARLSFYAAAKAGAVAFAKSLAHEVGRFNINVNVVSPGAVDTPLRQEREKKFLEQLGPEGYAKRVQDVLSVYPLRRLGTPRDVANTVAFLASDASGWITGQQISVSGGFTMV